MLAFIQSVLEQGNEFINLLFIRCFDEECSFATVRTVHDVFNRHYIGRISVK